MQKRKFTKEFKIQVLQELEAGKTIAELCREHDLKQDRIWHWKREYQKNPGLAFAGKGKPVTDDSKTAQLERKIGQLYLQVEFLQKVNANLQAALSESKKNAR